MSANSLPQTDPAERLPEDLRPASIARSPRVSVAGYGLNISSRALALIGNPERVVITFGPVSRMMAIRPSNTEGARVTGANGRVAVYHFLARFGIPDGHYRFTPRLVEGCLLVGPFPAADEGAS